MATQTLIFKPRQAHTTFTKAFIAKRDDMISGLIPRPSILLSWGMILVGLCVPLLMLVGWIPVSLLLGLVGFFLIATGSILMLVFVGEV